jgi:hypothetical protein
LDLIVATSVWISIQLGLRLSSCMKLVTIELVEGYLFCIVANHEVDGQSMVFINGPKD